MAGKILSAQKGTSIKNFTRVHRAVCSNLMKSIDCKKPLEKNEKTLLGMLPPKCWLTTSVCGHSAFGQFGTFDTIWTMKPSEGYTIALQSEQFDSHGDDHDSDYNSYTGLALLSWSIITLSAKSKKDAKSPRDPEKEALLMADELYVKNSVKSLYHLLVAYKDSDNAELLWRFARASRDLAQLSDTKSEDKKRLTYEGYHAAKKAIDRGPNNFACHKWYGIMLSKIGDYEGTKKKIQDSYAIRDHFLRAIELNPTDATSHHLLGVWCFTFADLAWYERKFAAAIFASPPTSTYEEALKHFEHAETIDPGFYSTNQLMLAKSYMKINKMDPAKYWFQKLLTFHAKTEEDLKNIQKAKEHLRAL